MYFVSMRHFDLGLGFHSRRLCILDTKKEKRGAGPRSDEFCVADSAAAADGETPSGVKAGGREAARDRRQGPGRCCGRIEDQATVDIEDRKTIRDISGHLARYVEAIGASWSCQAPGATWIVPLSPG